MWREVEKYVKFLRVFSRLFPGFPGFPLNLFENMLKLNLMSE